MFVSSQTNHKVTAYSSFIPVLTRFKCQDIRLTRSSTIYADKRVANKRLWPSNNFRLRMYLKSGYFFLSSFTYAPNFRRKRNDKFSRNLVDGKFHLALHKQTIIQCMKLYFRVGKDIFDCSRPDNKTIEILFA